MGGYMPAGALRADSTSACMSMAAKPASLPVDEYYGSFSSFLPTRDSSLSTLSTRDTAIVNIAAWSAIDADTTDSHAQLSDTDLADALQLADKVLTESATLPDMTDASGDAVLSSEVLRDLGLSPDLLGADGDESPQSTLEGSTGNGEHANEASGPESAASILETNRQLLIRLAEAQDRRAQSGDFGSIGDEEKAIASQLQTSLARAIAAHRPVAFRPPAEEIHRASQQLLAGSATNGIYSGTLPPQRRFAFISNASSHAGFPAGATTMPMERRAQPAK
ncbi:hypothetical protein GGI12_000537 [Dipsacomyces acuminosporus]|nr:hypothetical protein GGI12_000537 [Dipsacomyces acuminosporus]